jgi:hypothetical protein
VDFLEAAARRRLPAVGRDQARQEALSIAAFRAQVGRTRAVERPSGDLGATGLGTTGLGPTGLGPTGLGPRSSPTPQGDKP